MCDLWGMGAVAMFSDLFHWELWNPVSLLPRVGFPAACLVHADALRCFLSCAESVQQPWGLNGHVEHPDPLGMQVLCTVLDSVSSHMLHPAGVLLHARSKHPGM